MDNWFGWFFVAAGLFSTAGGAFDWDWFMDNRKPRLFVTILGRSGARILYILLGGLICTLGALGGLGVIDLLQKERVDFKVNSLGSLSLRQQQTPMPSTSQTWFATTGSIDRFRFSHARANLLPTSASDGYCRQEFRGGSVAIEKAAGLAFVPPPRCC